ncbi:hypothetical protein YB2330_000849 [Saitoella coloradoensis]
MPATFDGRRFDSLDWTTYPVSESWVKICRRHRYHRDKHPEVTSICEAATDAKRAFSLEELAELKDRTVIEALYALDTLNAIKDVTNPFFVFYHEGWWRTTHNKSPDDGDRDVVEDVEPTAWIHTLSKLGIKAVEVRFALMRNHPPRKLYRSIPAPDPIPAPDTSVPATTSSPAAAAKKGDEDGDADAAEDAHAPGSKIHYVFTSCGSKEQHWPRTGVEEEEEEAGLKEGDTKTAQIEESIGEAAAGNPIIMSSVRLELTAKAFAEYLSDTLPPGQVTYTYLFGSEDPQTGQSWCSDCHDADPLILRAVATFDAVLIQCPVGDRASWKSADNGFRVDETFRLTAIPTVIKWLDGEEVSRVVEEGCKDEAVLMEFFRPDGQI